MFEQCRQSFEICLVVFVKALRAIDLADRFEIDPTIIFILEPQASRITKHIIVLEVC